MANAYYVLPEKDNVKLNQTETHHLRVTRASIGERLLGLDGKGNLYTFELTSLNKEEAMGKIVKKDEVKHDNKVVTMAIAATKWPALRIALEKATELGVDRIEIFHSDRSVARFDERKITRIEKIIIEASKQCVNPFFPEFEITNSLNDNKDSFDLILDPSGTQPKKVMESLSKNTNVRIIVGPEGGFNQIELDELGKSGRFMSLGKRILRVETSVIVSLAYVNLAFNRL
ncbi:MAG: RsmE family RNA methyltransferase [Thermotogota bacterium]|nr:RsmE family RNA methyltransferase [Thermotogota bacterium]